jgi:hypothetical protein
MADDKLARLLLRFAAAARAHFAALELMDGERAARQADVIARLYAGIVREGEAGREGLLALLESHDPAVAGMAAVYSMRHSPDRCTALLLRLSFEPGLMGFRARAALDRWKAGEWELE